MSETVKRLVVVSDLHAGCRVGLCPSGGVTLDDGGTYLPSELQQKLWGMWREFWDEFVPEATAGEPWALVVNGDAIDGVHHGTTTQVSHNLLDQVRIAREILEPVVGRAQGGYYHVRGTEAHSGKSGHLEEELAEMLGAIPSGSGQFARYELWKYVGSHLIHCLHHIDGGGGSEAAAPYRELHETFAESARWGRRPADVIIRSHRHRYIMTEIPTGHVPGSSRGRVPSGTAACVVTPGWQGKTPFAWKTAGGRIQSPQFGGVVVDTSGGEVEIRRRVWTVSRSPAE